MTFTSVGIAIIVIGAVLLSFAGGKFVKARCFPARTNQNGDDDVVHSVETDVSISHKPQSLFAAASIIVKAKVALSFLQVCARVCSLGGEEGATMQGYCVVGGTYRWHRRCSACRLMSSA